MYIIGFENLTKVTISWYVFTPSASLNIPSRNYMLELVAPFLSFENLDLMLIYSTYLII